MVQFYVDLILFNITSRVKLRIPDSLTMIVVIIYFPLTYTRMVYFPYLVSATSRSVIDVALHG